jgi:hypothetical protein
LLLLVVLLPSVWGSGRGGLVFGWSCGSASFKFSRGVGE